MPDNDAARIVTLTLLLTGEQSTPGGIAAALHAAALELAHSGALPADVTGAGHLDENHLAPGCSGRWTADPFQCRTSSMTGCRRTSDDADTWRPAGSRAGHLSRCPGAGCRLRLKGRPHRCREGLGADPLPQEGCGA